MDFSAIFQNLQGSVVNVLAVNNQNQPVFSGTGVIVGNGQLVLTCEHCLVPNMRAVVRFSGSQQATPATVAFSDPNADLAVLETQKPLGPSVSLRSSTTVQVGQEAFVLGFPLGIDKLTALSAHVAGFEPANGFELIRIDSSVNHGNSGGPLFNSHGEVIGIINAKHGSLSTFLDQVERAPPGAALTLNNINPIAVLQSLIREMKENLNLGIGYAIPISHVGNLYPRIGAEIQP